MLDDVPRFRLQSERKGRWNMPPHQCGCGSKPANGRLRQDTPKPSHQRAPEQWTENGLHESYRQTVQ